MQDKNFENWFKAVACGDFCGSHWEGHDGPIDMSELTTANMLNTKTGKLTDDSVCTLAIASALLIGNNDFEKELRRYGNFYLVGYGYKFREWLAGKITNEEYNSWGNGSAMRVSPCAFIAKSLQEAEELAEKSCYPTHTTVEAIDGAKALAAAIYLAKTNHSKEDIRTYIFNMYYPNWINLDMNTYKYMVSDNTFDWYVRCSNIVPMCIQAFVESNDFVDALKLVISQGYDTDTAGAIVAPLAYAYYKHIPSEYLKIISLTCNPEMNVISDAIISKSI